MDRRATCALAALACVLIGSAPAPASPFEPPSERRHSGGISLRPNFRTGQEVVYTMKNTASTSVSGDGAGDESTTTETSSDQELGLTLRIVSTSPEGGADAELSFDRIIMSMDGPDGRMSFDSTHPPPNPGKGAPRQEDALAQALRPIVGQSLSLTLDARGSITEIKNLDKVLPQGPMGDLIRALIVGDGQTPAGAAAMITGLSNAPDTARRGDTWTNEDTMSLPTGPLTITTEHRVAAVRGKSATIETNGIIKPPASAGGGTSPLDGLISLKSSRMTGRYEWDARTGTLKSLSSIQTLTIEMGLPGIGSSVLTQNSSTSVIRDRVSEGEEPLDEPVEEPEPVDIDLDD